MVSSVDESALIDLGLIGFATLDSNFKVTKSRGSLSSWLQEGEVVTDTSAVFIGLEDELALLKDKPGDRLNLPDMTFDKGAQQSFYTVNVTWDDSSACFIVLTTMVQARENYLINATISERAQRYNADQLVAERRHFKHIYENSPHLAMSFHANGHITAVTDQLKHGYLQGQIPTKNLDSLADGHLAKVLVGSDIWNDVWADKRVVNVRMAVLDSDCLWRDLEVSGVISKHPNYQNTEAHFSFVDVTERNRARADLRKRTVELERLSERLQVSNHRFEGFAQVAAHDLMTPLRRITRLSQIISDEFKGTGSELLNTTLEELSKSAYGGRKLVNDVMELSRVASMDSENDALVPSEIMRMVEDEFSYDLEEIGAKVEYCGVDATVAADETLLFQIYRNLVSNAIKYRHQDRPLHIKHCLIESDNGLVIEVQDNGLGFDSDRYDVFGAFVRLVGNDHVHGTGVGLAIVKEAITTLDWQIHAQSTLGEGATFVIRCWAA